MKEPVMECVTMKIPMIFMVKNIVTLFVLNWCRNLNFYFWKVRFYTNFLL